MGGGTDLSPVVAKVTTHEYKGVRVRCRAHEASEMTDIVTWGVQQVEGPISKEIIGPKGADLQCRFFFGKVDLPYRAASTSKISRDELPELKMALVAHSK